MRQVQLARRILLHTPVQGFNPLVAGSRRVRVAIELQPGTSEPILCFEDGLVVNGHFNRLVTGIVEP